MLDWTEKHRPRTLDDLVGNGPAIEQMRQWAEAWAEGKPQERGLILAGDPGIGKTSAAHALAHDMGWGVIELNASDTRNEEVVKRIAGAGATHRAFGADGSFNAAAGGRQVVILDEADNLFGNADRGGMKAITETLREAKQPVILICNDYYELTRRGASLKTLCRTIKFSRPTTSIPKALRLIAQREKILLEEGVDKAIAENAGGDVRAAVRDLQALATGRETITLDDVKALGKRDTTGDIWAYIPSVFLGKDPIEVRKGSWELDLTPEDLALWIDENLPNYYLDKADLADGYKALSKADVFLGRRARRQDYGMWSYAGELMTSGVAAAKHTRPAAGRPGFPRWLSKQSQSKAARALRDAVATKVGAAIHTSPHRVLADQLPYLKALMQGEDFAIWAAWRFELLPEELAFLLDDKATSARVKKILEEAPKRHSVPVRVLTQAPAFGRYASDEDVVADEDDDEPTKPAAAADDDGDEAPAPKKTEAKKADAKPADAKPEPKRQRSLTDF
ncbi:MAG: replication factor large subunit [Thermoplasmata archaeon]|nr:replication factor large subunit [Thermoplasmata archaeon]